VLWVRALITVALMKKPNKGGRPPIFMKEIVRIRSMAGCLMIGDLRLIDVSFSKVMTRIVVLTIIM
jgi:hypothetical protein